MMKNLLTAGLVISGLASINAQQLQVKSAGEMSINRNNLFVSESQVQTVHSVQQKNQSAVPIGDTLCYFFNKHDLRSTNAQAQTFPIAYMPQPPTYSLTGVGSSFLNPGGAQVTVLGAMIMAMRIPNTNTSIASSTAIPVRVYVWSAGPTGVPGVKLDSAMTAPVTGTNGGSFYPATFTTPVNVTGAFFISYKSMPTQIGDTLAVFFSRVFTPTATSGTGFTPALAIGENLSFMRGGGGWGSSANSFGAGTEREVIVAPKVAFSYTADGVQMAPNGGTVSATGYCANSMISFSSTSGNVSVIENRQFNMNAFGVTYLPFVNTTSIVINPIYNWSFGGAAPSVPGTYTTANCSHFWGSIGNNANASLIVKYQHGTAGVFGAAGSTFTDLKSFPTFSIVQCGLPPIVGIQGNTINSGELSVYPNPVVNGKATVTGLEGINTVSVYNMLGQMVSTVTSDKENVSIDLTGQIEGTYLVRITDSYSKSKTIKIINQ